LGEFYGSYTDLVLILARMEWFQVCHSNQVSNHSWPGSKPWIQKLCSAGDERKQGIEELNLTETNEQHIIHSKE